MATYEGKVQSKDKEIIDVRKSSATGMKIGALKVGTSIKGDQLETGSDGKAWMHIHEPMEGWVLAAQLHYTESVVVSPVTPVVDTHATEMSAPDSTSITSPSNLYKVKKWGDPIMVEQGFDVNFVNTSNFQAVPLFIEDGSCGGVTSFL